MPASKPPLWLYHGTSHQAAIKLAAAGLRPKHRAFVHLSRALAMAKLLGSRQAAHPVIFRIAALAAFTAGALFTPTGSRVWLTGKIYSCFLTRMPTSGSPRKHVFSLLPFFFYVSIRQLLQCGGYIMCAASPEAYWLNPKQFANLVVGSHQDSEAMHPETIVKRCLTLYQPATTLAERFNELQVQTQRHSPSRENFNQL